MRLKYEAFCLTAFLFAALTVTAQSLAPEPDIPALIKQCGDNQRRMDSRVYEYSFTSREISHGLDRNGNPTKEVIRIFENFPRSQGSSKIALSKNGKTASENDVKKQREKAGKELEKDEQERLRQDQNVPERESGISLEQTDKKKVYFKVYNFLRADEFYNPRREIVGGREMIVLDFKPRTDLPELPPLIRSMQILVGRVWIDAADKIITRLEAWEPTASSLTSNGIEPQIVLQYSLLPEGIWLLGGARINTVKNPSLFNDVLIDWKFENINFHHFETEVKDFNIDKN